MAPTLVNRYYYSRINWVDGTTQFKEMIMSRLNCGSKVLDVGAGSGRGYKHDYRDKVACLVGIDISSEVLQNQYLDEAYCCDAAQMPFKNGDFDLAFSDYVFEHLPDPHAVIKEIYRVLKPNGYFLLRTPNKWYFISLIAAVLPRTLQVSLLDRFTNTRAQDVFPKFFRCNTEKSVKLAFEQVGFVTEELLLIEKEPTYFIHSPFLYRIGVLYEKLTNSSDTLRHFRSNIFGVFRK
jgi:ubiquinone/menaquinone biosynthesis C-methylase UbiE